MFLHTLKLKSLTRGAIQAEGADDNQLVTVWEGLEKSNFKDLLLGGGYPPPDPRISSSTWSRRSLGPFSPDFTTLFMLYSLVLAVDVTILIFFTFHAFFNSQNI